MKQTVLDMTQSILSGLSSDEVNSISDTSESLQVAEIIRQTYFNLISRLNIPNHTQLVQLDPSLNVSDPVVMYVPQGVSKIEWVKYFNSRTTDSTTPPLGYTYVTVLPITQFIEMVNMFNPNDTNVESFTFADNSNNYPSNYTFYFMNDRQPNFCTILSNYYVIFDSYDNTQDSTLQASKSMALGEIIPTFSMTDTFIPNLTDEQFTLLLNEAKSLAFFELKQTGHAKAEQESKRQWSSLQRTKHITDVPSDFDQLPNFGRKGPGGPRRDLINWGGSSYSWL